MTTPETPRTPALELIDEALSQIEAELRRLELLEHGLAGQRLELEKQRRWFLVRQGKAEVAARVAADEARQRAKAQELLG